MRVVIRIQHPDPRQPDLLLEDGLPLPDDQKLRAARLYSEMIEVQKASRAAKPDARVALYRNAGKILAKCPTQQTDLHKRPINLWMLVEGFEPRQDAALVHQMHGALNRLGLSVDAADLERLLGRLAAIF